MITPARILFAVQPYSIESYPIVFEDENGKNGSSKMARFAII
jgi:hypothetical protein